MPRKQKTPAGGTAGAGAAGQVAAINASATEYNTLVKSPQQGALPLALSRQIDCAVFLEESTQDPVVKSFARIALRRLEASIPSDGGRP